MMGSYLNPHAIQPGEILSAQALFDRFLSWNEYRSDNHSWDIQETCNPDLFAAFLCCDDHFRLSHESDDFNRYFYHIDPMSYEDQDSVKYTLKGFIRRQHITFDLEKLAKNIFMTVDDCQEFLTI